MSTINYRRYSVASEWRRTGWVAGPFEVEAADLLDKRTGRVYTDGAARVVDTRTGKTVDNKGAPAARNVFAGEMAYAAVESTISGAFWESHRYKGDPS